MTLAQFSIQQRFFLHNPSQYGFWDTNTLITVVLKNAIIVAGVLLLLLIIYAGYQLIILGGQYNPPERVARAKALVTYALIGFLLVVSAYFILQIVSTITGVNFMNANVT
jgi:heme/copper-type cytochrome/quinol oxidase subunit 4